MDNNLKRQIILEHYEHSPYRGIPNDPSYIKINNNNVSCIDNIDLYLKINNGIIEDIRFEGEACVIAISSTSILCKLVINKKISDVESLINNYLNMINEKEYNIDIIDEAFVFCDIGKQPSRKTCATLTWKGLYNYLNL